jgi:uncharacterized membrane protein YagU involved in acid resistance
MIIGSFFRRRPRRSLFVDILSGAAAGALGTVALNQAFKLAGKLQPKPARQPAKEPQEKPTETVARKALEPVGIHLEGERKKNAGEAVHWGYGITWGAIYGALHRLLPQTGRHFGLGFGLGLFLFGDVLLLPTLRLSPPAHKLPLPAHLSAIAAHLAYGSAAEGSYRLFRQALA